MRQSIFYSLIILILYPFPGYAQSVKGFSVFNTESAYINDICFTSNGELIGITDLNAIKVFTTTSRELIAEFTDGHRSEVQTIDIAPDGSLLVSGGRDSTIVIWDFINKKKIKTLRFQGSIITSVKISPGSKYIASGGIDKLFLYDIEQDRVTQTLDYCDFITSVAFSPDEKIVASACADKSIYIHETESGNLITKLTAHKNWVRGLAFSKDGSKLISGGDDLKIIIWDISDLNNIKIHSNSKHSSSWILSVDFNQDNMTYAFGDFNGNTEIIGRFGKYKMNVKSPINKILFKPNQGINLIIAVATRGKGALIIDAKNMGRKSR